MPNAVRRAYGQDDRRERYDRFEERLREVLVRIHPSLYTDTRRSHDAFRGDGP